jgi:uncharacterized RmlC-like cupin family protein
MSIRAQVQDAASSEQHCIAITPGEPSQGKQGIPVFEGISAQSAGARALCMHIIAMPPGGRARAHLHEAHESAVYVVEGEAICWYGDQLQHSCTARAGEMTYIPAGVPHLPINASADEPVVCIVARTDPNEQESVVVLPELDVLAHVNARAGVVERGSVRR